MNPEKEKTFLRILKTVTALSLASAIVIIFTASGFPPFASILGNDETVRNRPEEETAVLTPPERKKIRNMNAPVTESTADELTVLRKQAALSPLSPEAYVAIGEINFTRGDFASAEENFHLASSLAPEDSAIFIRYIQTLLRQRKVIEADTEMRKRETDKLPIINLYRGYISAYLNKPQKAKEILGSLLRNESGLQEKAVPILNAYEIFDSTIEGKQEYLQTLLAKAFNNLGEYELAIGLALDAIKTRDQYRDAWIVAGHSALALGEYAEAEKALKKAIELDATSGESFLYLALTLQKLEKFGEAANTFKKARELGIEITGDIETSLLKQAESAGNYADALTLEETLLSQKTVTSPEEYIHAMHIAIDKANKPERALELAKRANSAFPNKAMSKNLLGWAYLALGETANAIIYLDEALDLNPTLESAHYNYGKLYEAAGKTQNALEAFQKSVQFAKEHGNASIESAASSKLNFLKTLP